MRRMSVVLLALATIAATAGCSSSARHYSDARQTGSGGPAVLAAPPTARSAVRLGLVAAADDGIALVGVQDNMFREDLGGQAPLDAVRFSSASSAGLAMEQGRLDAAYLDPVTAVRLWQATREQIRVMAGAASAGSTSLVVLVVTAHFLLVHPLWVQALLKGQIQAMHLLAADPVSGHRMAAAELTALGQRTTSAQFAQSSAGLLFTCDPLPASVLNQAQKAAAAGTFRPVTSLAAMYDLVPVDELLRAAGFKPVSTTAG